MAQLNQIIWSNITWGACGIFFMCLFGIAIKFEWNSQLTPKAWNRPRNVLKNVLKDHRIFGCWNLYPITWFLWARKLTYPQGMEGIPGTGTRDDGWSGPTLKMTLDGVILLKFHRMLFKISLLATLLCCGVLLPTYTTSTCDPEIVTERECRRLSSLTDFENLTISHVPEVRRNDDVVVLEKDHRKNDVDSENENENNNNGDDDHGNSEYEVGDDDHHDASGWSSFFSFGSTEKKKNALANFTATHYPVPAIAYDDQYNALVPNNKLLDEEGNIIIPPAPVATQHTADSKWVPGISWRLMTTALCSAIIYAYTCCKFCSVGFMGSDGVSVFSRPSIGVDCVSTFAYV